MIVPVILCGGAGRRLWPASTGADPKAFISLFGDRSLFEQTVLRVAPLAEGSPLVVVVHVDHVGRVRALLAALGVEGLIIAEPEGRNSGPALVAAAAWMARDAPEASLVAVASDHAIADDEGFRAAVRAALPIAAAGEIVVFGVRPRFPATGYGYIRPAETLAGACGARRVERFVEKPDAAGAAALIATGCLWNSGNFVFRAGDLVREAEIHAPSLWRSVAKAVDEARKAGDVLELARAFRAAPKVSIDVAVMEKTGRAAVLEASHDWSDLGSWDAVWAASVHDARGNTIVARAVVVDSQDCLIRADAGAQIVAVGLRNIAVVVREGRILVCDLGASQALKTAVEGLD